MTSGCASLKCSKHWRQAFRSVTAMIEASDQPRRESTLLPATSACSAPSNTTTMPGRPFATASRATASMARVGPRLVISIVGSWTSRTPGSPIRVPPGPNLTIAGIGPVWNGTTVPRESSTTVAPTVVWRRPSAWASRNAFSAERTVAPESNGQGML